MCAAVKVEGNKNNKRSSLFPGNRQAVNIFSYLSTSTYMYLTVFECVFMYKVRVSSKVIVNVGM